jgi:hypothetical protein
VAEKRAAKSVIDVAFDRLGDAVGGGIVRMAIVFLPAVQSPAILCAAAVTSAGAIVISSGLNRWYLRTLEKSLVRQGGGLHLSTTRVEAPTAILSGRSRASRASVLGPMPGRRASHDPDIDRIVALRSRDRERIVEVLSSAEGLSPSLIAHVIPLLAWEPVAERAAFALRKVAEERVGELTDALLDPNQDHAVRRRLARILSVCVSQRAADALLAALTDSRFDVRFYAARSLAGVCRKNPRVRIDRDRVHETVLREVAVSRTVWDARRLPEGVGSASPLDATCSRSCRSSSPRSRCRSRCRGWRHTTPTSAGRRSSTWKSCCRRRSGSVCGRCSSRRHRRCTPRRRPGPSS